MIYVGGRVVSISMDVSVVPFEKRPSGYTGAFVSWLYSGIQLDRVNGDHSIFLM